MEKPRPGRDVAIVIGLKLALLTVIFLLFFTPSRRPEIDDAAVARHLLDPRTGETQ